MTVATRRRGRIGVGPLVASMAAIASSAVLAACGSASSSAASATASAPARSLATSLSTATDSWAIVPMTANPTFWEVFVRSAKSSTWRLVTPPGVADNGGLVAAANAASGLTVAVRPSQDLEFTPVASTADAGAKWSTDGPISGGVASSPDALAVSGGEMAALLGNGAIETSADAGSSWQTLAKPGAIADSAAGKKCGAVTVTSVSFGSLPEEVLAAGSCGAAGTTDVFSHTAADGWQRVTLPVSGQLLRLSPGNALIRAKAGLTELWGDEAFGWYAYAPLSATATPSAASSAAAWTASAPLPVTNAVTASGGLAGTSAASPGGTWVLLPGGQAATIAGPGAQWLLLPPTPAHTSVLASGPGNSVDALAVSGATLTVWQLNHGSTVWTKVQTIRVPIQYGSSS